MAGRKSEKLATKLEQVDQDLAEGGQHPRRILHKVIKHEASETGIEHPFYNVGYGRNGRK